MTVRLVEKKPSFLCKKRQKRETVQFSPEACDSASCSRIAKHPFVACCIKNAVNCSVLGVVFITWS